MGFFDKLKRKAKSGIEGAQKSAQERRERRDHLKGIEQKERLRQEEKHRRFKVQEEYRQKRKNIKSGDSRADIGGLFGVGGGSGAPFDFFLGAPEKQKRKRRKKRKKKTQSPVVVIIQEPKKKKRRKRRKRS